MSSEVQSIAPENDSVVGVFDELKVAAKYLKTLTTKNNTIFKFVVEGEDEIKYVVCQTRDRAGYLILRDMFSEEDMNLSQVSRDELYALIT